MKFRSLLVTGGFVVAAGIGCTLAVDFEDHPGDSGASKKDATSKTDTGIIPEDSGPKPEEDSNPGYDPPCMKAAPFTGLPRVDDKVVDSGYNVVCCNGKLTDLSMPQHCGGCGIDCNTGGNGYACKTFVGDAGAHAYCAGCLTKFPADPAAANASCQSNLCSSSNPFGPEGRCAPSNGSNDCVEAVCANTYVGAACGRYADAGPVRDPSFFCVYQ